MRISVCEGLGINRSPAALDYNWVAHKKPMAFAGTPVRMPQRVIRDMGDIISQWNLLRNAKYFDVHDDHLTTNNKIIRQENYEFLDKISSPAAKHIFVTCFRQLTGFPDLGVVSGNMIKHFRDTIQGISRDLNAESVINNKFDIISWGIDPTCSAALGKAFPGSDLDKAYVLLRGNPYLSIWCDDDICNKFKAGLWERLDQRLVGLNHPNTFPHVTTLDGLTSNLNLLDRKTEEMLHSKNAKGIQYYEKLKSNSEVTEPIKAAEFNIDLARSFGRYEYTPKENAKNFAFFVEVLFDNLSSESDPFWNFLKKSTFAQLSNVTQTGALKKRLATGYLKPKLKARADIQQKYSLDSEPFPLLKLIQFFMHHHFSSYSYIDHTNINNIYRLVKQIIKASSNDLDTADPEILKYFHNSREDISTHYDPLLEVLKG